MNEVLPEYYSDVYHLRTSPWGLAVTFGVSSPKESIREHDVCVIRLSHVTAKTLAMMMRKQLKQYERDTATTVAVPSKVMTDLGLLSSDW